MPSTLSKLSCVYWGNFRRFLRSFGPCVSQSFLVATPPLQPGPVLGGRLCHSEWRGREGKWQPWSEVASRPLACGLACRWRFAWPAPFSCAVWISCQYLQMRGSHIKNTISASLGEPWRLAILGPHSQASGGCCLDRMSVLWLATESSACPVPDWGASCPISITHQALFSYTFPVSCISIIWH